MGTGQEMFLPTENTDEKLEEEMAGPTSHWYKIHMELMEFFIRCTETSDLPYFPGGQWLGMQWITLYKTSSFNSAGMAQCILTLMSLKKRERRGEKKRCPCPTSSHLNMISFYGLFISASLFCLSADEPESLLNNIPEGSWWQHFLFPMVLVASPVHS